MVPDLVNTGRMLSGPTAWAWHRRIVALTIAAFGVAALGVVVVITGQAVGFNAAPAGLLLLGGPLLAGSTLLQFAHFPWTPRAREEAQAGYTTLPVLHPNIDHLHPVTGDVIRRAGEQPLTRAQFRLVMAGVTPPPETPVAVSAKVVWLEEGGKSAMFPPGRSWGLVSIMLAAAALLGLGVALSADGAPPKVLVLVPVLVAFVAFVMITQRTRERRVREHRPDALLVGVLLMSDLRQAVTRLGRDAPRGYGATIAISDSRFEVWAGASETPALVVLWADVISAGPGLRRTGDPSTIVVVVRASDGQAILPLRPLSPWFFVGPSGARLNEVLSAIRTRIPQR